MIKITSYAKRKGNSSSSAGGGGYANIVNNNSWSSFYAWGQLFDGSDVNGDITTNGNVTGDKADFNSASIDLLYAINEYLTSISGDTAYFNNLSATTTNTNNITVNENANIGGDLSVTGDTTLTDVTTNNITNSDTIKTKNLEVSGLAHFFELVIDKIKNAGGAVLLTPADGFDIDYVGEDDDSYILYFRSTDENGKGISNMWKVNDQAICQSFNQATVGDNYNVANKYYWTLVTGVDDEPVELEVSGETHDYHYIKVSKSVYDGELNPEEGDTIAMLGYRGNDDEARQSAIYLTSYTSLDQGLSAPAFAEYKGINDFSLSSHRKSYIDATGAHFQGEFYVNNTTTIQDYTNSAITQVFNEFSFDINGLTSRVSRLSNPNILPANGWTDQDSKSLLQEDDEEYIFDEDESATSNAKGLTASSDDDLVGCPPIIYLNAGQYTLSTYSQVKYETIKWGYTKDNLEFSLDVKTAFNSGDTWHNQSRAITTFQAPENGYYFLGMKMMDESYSGDTVYVDPEESGSTSGHTTGTTPSCSGDCCPCGKEDEPIPTTIHITMSDIVIGQTKALGKEITPADFDGIVTYTSSNPSIASVDDEGNVTAYKVGDTLITAQIKEQYLYNGKHYLGSSDSLTVNVADSTIQVGLTAEVDRSNLLPNETAQITTTVTPSSYNGTVIYSSSDESIATVDSTGKVTCLKEGDVVITVTAPDSSDDTYTYKGATATISLSIAYTEQATSIYIEPDINRYYVSNSATVEATVTPSSYPNNIKYSTSDSNIATVDSSGKVLFNAVGNVTITAYVDEVIKDGVRYTASSASIEYTVRNINVSGDVLTLTALSDGHLYVAMGQHELEDDINLYYSLNGSEYKRWTAFYGNDSDAGSENQYTHPIKLLSNDVVKIIGNNPKGFGYYVNEGEHLVFNFEYTNKCNLSGNIMSIISPECPSTIPADYCFMDIFNTIKVVDASDLILPATKLTKGCYSNMFLACKYLEKAPELQATTLAEHCYEDMFEDCTALTTPPSVLPATTLADWCYSDMFRGCTALTIAPKLSATTLAESSCYGMFQECKALTTAPELPATTLAHMCCYEMFRDCTALTTAQSILPALSLKTNCYQQMFQGCTALTTAPNLPATTLANGCYDYMFQDCSSLNYVKAMFNTSPIVNSEYVYTENWLKGVSSSGTFIKSKDATWDVRGDSAIPTGWVVETADDDTIDTTITLTLPDNLKPGDTGKAVVEITPSSYTGTVTYSSSDESIAKVDSNGNITCLKSGSVRITASIPEIIDGVTKYESASTSAVMYVGYILQTKLELSYPNTMYVGDTYQISATTTPEEANEFTYSSSDESIATVDDNGLVNTVGAGYATITVTVADWEDIENNITYKGTSESIYLGVKEAYTGSSLVFTALEDNSTVGISGNQSKVIYYSTDNKVWSEYTFDDMISLNNGDSVYFMSPNDRPMCDSSYNNYNHFKMTGKIAGSGSVQALFNNSSTVPENGCTWLFIGCKSLATAPELPATTLSKACYQSMFYGCTALTTAPELPATTLTEKCYQQMFYGCSSLKYVKALFTEIGSSSLNSWLSGVPSSGTFIKSKDATWDESSVIPTGWTVETADE